MTRPLRIEFSGALYHVTSRGDGREAIYLCDNDRFALLYDLDQVCEHFNRIVLAYCLMTNHPHFVKLFSLNSVSVQVAHERLQNKAKGRSLHV